RVDGNLIGQVTSNSRLHISKSGKGEGSIIAKNIEIGGEFFGDLFATDKVILRSTAYVKAKITSRYLEVEEGAYYCGQCKVTSAELAHPSDVTDDSLSQQELAESSI
ncbi:MAG: polymer-forming cytoskeletal protein, partial [Spirochaetota bacterium]|nr:polymer-forming cytoskeletal protein [Spirochaetota bacterium]